MNRLLIATCLLAGCAGGGHNASPPEVYDFGLPVARLAVDARWANVALEVSASPWLDSREIEYRLLYEDPLKLRSYSASRWAAAPRLLLSQRLRQQLGLVGAGAPAACLLRLDLQEFSQVFATPASSRAMLLGRASLVDARRQLIGERPLAIEQPAPTADARGGVVALVAASDDLGRQFAAWLNDLEKHGRLQGCRSPAGESQ